MRSNVEWPLHGSFLVRVKLITKWAVDINTYACEDTWEPYEGLREMLISYAGGPLCQSPKYVLMENVVDILKFAEGFLGRYAVSHLVSMNYQARLGMMAAGSYGVLQFRMSVFLWGAQLTEKLPPYPLPNS